ncbi:MAG: hypothetical protein M5U26_13320 [Planctomycetota bacterium]|nr:hypothetical protein [Planctomycetota bacterium]
MTRPVFGFTNRNFQPDRRRLLLLTLRALLIFDSHLQFRLTLFGFAAPEVCVQLGHAHLPVPPDAQAFQAPAIPFAFECALADAKHLRRCD